LDLEKCDSFRSTVSLVVHLFDADLHTRKKK